MEKERKCIFMEVAWKCFPALSPRPLAKGAGGEVSLLRRSRGGPPCAGGERGCPGPHPKSRGGGRGGQRNPGAGGQCGGARGGRLLPWGRVVHNFLPQAFCHPRRAPSAAGESQQPDGHAVLGEPHQEAATSEKSGGSLHGRLISRRNRRFWLPTPVEAKGPSPGGAGPSTGGGRAGEGFSCWAAPLARPGAVLGSKEVNRADSPLVLITPAS